MRRPLYGRRQLLAYGLWIIGVVLAHLIVYGFEYYGPPTISVQAVSYLPKITGPIVQAIITWLVFQIVISHRYLPWLIVVTLLGQFVGNFLVGYFYALWLSPGYAIGEMLLRISILALIIAVSIAIFQVLFMGLILKRIGWIFALTWIVAAMIASVISSILVLAPDLGFYSHPSVYLKLIQSAVIMELLRGVIVGIISGLPLIWLRTRTSSKYIPDGS